jgi:hypothetical protein
MEGTKPRSNSGYYGDQGHEGTCYAHATTRMIARLIKVIFSSFFNEGERCSELYVTEEDISNIYSKHGTWEKCKDEMLSALLFRLIYKIIRDDFGSEGASVVSAYNFVIFEFDEIQKKKSLKYIKDKIQYIEIISKIHSLEIVKQLEEVLKLLLSIICVFVNFINLKIINLKIYYTNGGSLNSLIKVLKKRCYATISDLKHVMTITGYKMLGGGN